MMRTAIALALLAAAVFAEADVACDLGPGRLVAKQVVQQEELWPSTWSRIKRAWADDGGMLLHQRMLDDGDDYLICVLYVPEDASVDVGAGTTVVLENPPGYESIAIYRPHDPQEYGYDVPPFTVRGDDHRRTRSGGYLLVVAFPPGTLTGKGVDDVAGLRVLGTASAGHGSGE